MSRLFHVNAFSQHPFGGNPAIVVLGPERSDAELQAMAAEFNLSETAFLTPWGRRTIGCAGLPRRSRWISAVTAPWRRPMCCGRPGLWPAPRCCASRPAAACWRPGAEGEWIRLDFPRIPLAPLTGSRLCRGPRLHAAADPGRRRQVPAGARQRGGGAGRSSRTSTPCGPCPVGA
jgi:hypothetical protein